MITMMYDNKKELHFITSSIEKKNWWVFYLRTPHKLRFKNLTSRIVCFLNIILCNHKNIIHKS